MAPAAPAAAGGGGPGEGVVHRRLPAGGRGDDRRRGPGGGPDPAPVLAVAPPLVPRAARRRPARRATPLRAVVLRGPVRDAGGRRGGAGRVPVAAAQAGRARAGGRGPAGGGRGPHARRGGRGADGAGFVADPRARAGAARRVAARAAGAVPVVAGAPRRAGLRHPRAAQIQLRLCAGPAPARIAGADRAVRGGGRALRAGVVRERTPPAPTRWRRWKRAC